MSSSYAKQRLSTGCLIVILIIWSQNRSLAQGEIPVDMYTGTPSISVPIWKISDHDISEPIVMAYNANGVKGNSRYGVGWNLLAGGAVSREVRGLPDDFGNGDTRKGWFYNSNSTTIANFANSADLATGTITDETSDNSAISAFGYLVDTEPDIFSFSFAGYSGSFVFDNSLNIRTIPFQDLKIEFTPVSSTDKRIVSFKITTNEGYAYTFSDIGAVTRQTVKYPGPAVYYQTTDYEFYKSPVQYYSDWKLSRIDSPTGAYLTFSYVSESITSSQNVNVGLYRVKEAWVLGSTDLSIISHYSVNETVSNLYLAHIYASSGPQIDFDYDPGAKSLTSITIRDLRKGTSNALSFVKGFAFGFQSVPYSDGASVVYSKQFLKSIVEYSGCDRMPPYKFSYMGIGDNTYMQHPGNNIDFWGYFNGGNNSHLIPKMYVYPGAAIAERYRFSRIPNYQGQEIILEGADRNPGNWAKQIGTLNTIVYPQGGITSLTFESDQYFDAATNQSLLGGGLRIAAMTYMDGLNPTTFINKTFEYKDGYGNSSGRLIGKPVFAMPAYNWVGASGSDVWKFLTVRSEVDISTQESTHGNPVGYQVVTVKRPGSGYAKFEYNEPGVYGELTNGNWAATNNKFARPNISPAPDMGVVTAGGAWMFPNAPNPTFDYERGLLSQKSEFNSSNKLVRKTINSYQYLYGSGTQPILVAGLRYDKYAFCDVNSAANKIFLYGKYGLLTNVNKVLKKEIITTYDANELTTSTKYMTESTEYIYGSANHKLITQVKRTGGDGTIHTTRIKYPKDYSNITSNAEQAVLMISNLQSNFRHGIPIEQINTVKLGTDSTRVIGGSLVKFDPFDVGKPLVESQWSVSAKASIRIDSFKNSSVLLQGTYKFDFDPHYERVLKYNDYATAFQPNSGVGQDRQTTGAAYGYNSSLPLVQFKNALSSQLAFSDFETTNGFDFTSSSSYYGAGRTGSNSFYPGVMLTKTIIKASVNNYILSFWIKSNASLNFTVSLKNSPGNTISTYYTNAFSVASTGGNDFKYVQQIIPVTNVTPSSFNIELQAASLTTPPAGGSSPSLIPVVDDVAFYPENADLTSYTYQIPYGATAVSNANGKGSITVYDNLGRPRYLMNQDKNILQKNTYKFANDGIQLLADFAVPELVYVAESTTLTGRDNSCLSNVVYHWYFGADSIQGQTQSRIFANTGTIGVTLKVTKAGYPSQQITKIVTVIQRPIDVTICAKGVQQFSASGNQIVSSYSCSNITTTPPTYGVIFKINSISVSECSYKWKIRDVGTTAWIDVGNGSEQYTYQKVLATSHSFEVMCFVQNGDRTGSSIPVVVTVSP